METLRVLVVSDDPLARTGGEVRDVRVTIGARNGKEAAE